MLLCGCFCRFTLVQKHTVEFNQVAMANSEGSEVMLNRVMTKDNIGVAVLLEVNKDMFSGGKTPWVSSLCLSLVLQTLRFAEDVVSPYLFEPEYTQAEELSFLGQYNTYGGIYCFTINTDSTSTYKVMKFPFNLNRGGYLCCCAVIMATLFGSPSVVASQKQTHFSQSTSVQCCLQQYNPPGQELNMIFI